MNALCLGAFTLVFTIPAVELQGTTQVEVPCSELVLPAAGITLPYTGFVASILILWPTALSALWTAGALEPLWTRAVAAAT